MLRKEEIQRNAETFGKVSPLLSWFAHRVTTHVMKDDDTDEEEEATLEEGALVKKQVFLETLTFFTMIGKVLSDSLRRFYYGRIKFFSLESFDMGKLPP